MTTLEPRCLICGGQPTVRSHLLPRAFVHEIRGNDRHVLMTDRGRPGRRFTQAGPFSADIFCNEHEATTGGLDRVAVNFCRDVYAGPPRRAGTIVELSEYDPSIIIRFVCSILLRCDFSSRDEARGIHLGPYASIMADVVFGGDLNRAPDVYVYAAVGQTVDFRELASLPASRRVDGYRRWSFNVGGVAFVADLNRDTPAEPDLVLQSGRPIRGPVFDFDNTELGESWRTLIAQ